MLPIFAFTLLLSSALLFLVEPMFAKMVLPLLGSTPAVWNTAVLFFQGALLTGYAYAHLSTRWLGERRQAALHAMVLFLPLLVLPIAIPFGWTPPSESSPTAWLLALLAVAVGLPFVVVSATAPLLQRWFAASGHHRAGDPYFLYGASNLGSAIGLLGYPILMEPALGLSDQSRAWTVGYVGLIAVSLASAGFLWRSRCGESEPHGGGPAATPPAAQRISAPRRLRWVALAFVPASLMLGLTSYLTLNIAPIPLLWVIPLTLYLLSFVVAFSPRAGGADRLAGRMLPFAVVPTVLTIVLEGGRPLWLIGGLHVLTFFLAAVVCHGQLARDRPPSAHLTEFYLWIAIGGVLGGAFNSLAAPVVFDSFAEYPLVMVLALLFRPRPTKVPDTVRQRVLDLAIPAGLGLTVLLLGMFTGGADPAGGVLERSLLVGIPAAVCVTFLARPVRFGLGIGALILATSVAASTHSPVIHAERTFFGMHRVERDPNGRLHLLLHGTTIHGAQSLDPARRRGPLTYYSTDGPLGQVFQAYRRSSSPRRVAVVGLGTGSMACHARPDERWTFYEIDPEVARIAQDPALFTYLRDCLDGYDVVLGDARLSLARPSGHRYGLLAVDAFNSDAIPVHLLTREALRLYLSRLGEGGLLAFHISNNYVDLHPILANLAADARLVAYARDEEVVSPERSARGIFPSDWVVVARTEADLNGLEADPRWRRLGRRPDFPVWTDDFSNLLRVLRLD